jgi:hypothetical protein
METKQWEVCVNPSDFSVPDYLTCLNMIAGNMLNVHIKHKFNLYQLGLNIFVCSYC